MTTRPFPASPTIASRNLPPETRGVAHAGGSAHGASHPTPATEIPGGNARLLPKLEALAATMLANPTMGQKELAQTFGVGVTWIWSVTRSDAFRTLLAQRAEELYSDALRTVRDRMERVAELALGKLETQLEHLPMAPDMTLEISKAMLDRIGHGSRSTTAIEMGGEVTHTHRAGLINDTRAALLQRNRSARMKALGLSPGEEEEVVIDGTSGEISAGGASGESRSGDAPPGVRETQAITRGTSEGAEV